MSKKKIIIVIVIILVLLAVYSALELYAMFIGPVPILNFPRSNKFTCQQDSDCGLCSCWNEQECVNVSWYYKGPGKGTRSKCTPIICLCQAGKCVEK